MIHTCSVHYRAHLIAFMAVWFPHCWFSGIFKRCGQMLGADNIVLLQQLFCCQALSVPSNPNCDVRMCHITIRSRGTDYCSGSVA